MFEMDLNFENIDEIEKQIKELEKRKKEIKENKNRLEAPIHFSKKDTVGCLTINPNNIISYRELTSGHLEVILNDQACQKLELLFKPFNVPKIDKDKLIGGKKALPNHIVWNENQATKNLDKFIRELLKS